MKILLVEPDFPIPNKSKNHSSFLPVGLLKIAGYHREVLKDKVQLIRGNKKANFAPDKILITSLFTYWSKYVKDSVEFYKELYPNASIEVGGIYASLLPEHCKQYTKCDIVSVGLYADGKAEACKPAYDLIKVDYQIIHASRGCFRHCNFCGVWKIEKNISYKSSIKKEIRKKKLVFYDNNLLTNPYIENILNELVFKKVRGKAVVCESQSGLDGRILEQKPHFAVLLKKAHFQNPRIAWDGGIKLKGKIYKQIKILLNAGYSHKDIYAFMLYNHENMNYSELIEKLEACRQWGIQVIDCRYRPLTATDDGYNSHVRIQAANEYHIANNWTDEQVRGFRKAVRRQNIAIRLNLSENRYIEGMEKGFVKNKKTFLTALTRFFNKLVFKKVLNVFWGDK